MLRTIFLSLGVLLPGMMSPGSAATITRIGTSSFGITDGTSNTIQIGETARATVCIQNPTGSIADGTSNTILFGEGGGFQLVGGTVHGFGNVSAIADGASNTIFLGETSTLTSFCLQDAVLGPPVPVPGDGLGNTLIIGESSTFDLCLTNVSWSIGDGTSNTLQLGSTYCATDLRLNAETVIEAAQVPLPGALGFGLAGIGLLSLLRRRVKGPS